MKELGRKPVQHLLPIPFLVAPLMFVDIIFIYLPSILFQSTRLRVSRSASSIHTYTTTCRQFTGVLGVDRTLWTV